MAKSNVHALGGPAFGVALATAAIVLGLNGPDIKVSGWRWNWTARWSFLLFFLAYAATPWPPCSAGRRLVGMRGSSVCLLPPPHFVHVGLVIWLGVILGKVPLSGGLLLFFLVGLFFTYLLAALSFGRRQDAGRFLAAAAVHRHELYSDRLRA